MGFKIPRKALSTEGLARWAQNERLRGRKTLFFAKICTLAPKNAFWPLFAVLSAKRAEIDLGRLLAPKTCPEPYVFHCFALGAKKTKFCYKVVVRRKKINEEVIPCATQKHEIMLKIEKSDFHSLSPEAQNP